MGYLLDTHALIWWWLGDQSLSATAFALIEGRDTDIHVSAVAGMEIATKVRAGKLPTMAAPLDRFDESVTADAFKHLPVRHDHAIRAGLLPTPHRDPWDRLIAAQGLVEGLTIITRDRAFAAFGCKVAW